MLVKEKHDWHQIRYFFLFYSFIYYNKKLCATFFHNNKCVEKKIEKKAQVDPTTDQDGKSKIYKQNVFVCTLLTTTKIGNFIITDHNGMEKELKEKTWLYSQMSWEGGEGGGGGGGEEL